MTKWWLAAILVLAVFFRLWDLKDIPPGLWTDEAVNGNNTLSALASGDWKVFYPENFGREGLFINIQSLFVWAFGTEPWVLRLPSTIFGILTVLGLYLITKELFGKRTALFTAFFLATSFWHINFSRIGFRAIMAPLFLVWSFYFLFLGIRLARSPQHSVLRNLKHRVFSRAHPEICFAIAGVFLGLGFHTYIAFRVAPIIALLPLWKFYRNGVRNVCAPCLIVLFIFMAVVAASPLLIYYAQNQADFFGRTAGISIFESENPLGQFSENVVKTFQMFVFFGDFNWRHNFSGSPQLWWPVGILFLIGICESLRNGARPKRFPYAFVLFWCIIMLLPVAVSNEGLPHALRAIILIPPAMIFAALGLEQIIIKIKKRLYEQKIKYPENVAQINRIGRELFILLLAFFAAAVIQTFNQYFLRWAPNYNVYHAFQTDLSEKAQWLKHQPNEIKKYVVTGETDRVDVTGTPMSLQPIIFITNTFLSSKQKEKNIYYLPLNGLETADCAESCIIVPVENNSFAYQTIKQKIPGVRLDTSPGFVILKK